MTSIAIPDPSPGVDVEQIDIAGILAWLEDVDDIDSVDEIKQRAIALEQYLTKRGDQGPAQTIARMSEVRIGELLGDGVRGRPWDKSDRDRIKKIAEDDRRLFRLMAKYREVVEDTIPDSRARILKAIERYRRRYIDDEARAITRLDIDDDSGDGWAMLAGDFADRAADLADGSIDLIVTDPPYPREFLGLWSLLAEQAARILKPQGILVALSGMIMLPEVISRLGEHLAYGWTYCQPMPGSPQSRILARQVVQSYKPWLAYSNGAWPSGRIDWHADTLEGSVLTKDLYRWQQAPAPARLLISYLAPENGLVLDPFAGVGTYGAAALEAGRRFVGVEVDHDRFATACRRLPEISDHDMEAFT